VVTRRGFVGRALIAGAGLLTVGRLVSDAAAATGATGSTLSHVSVRNGATAFVGDRARFATISPRSANARAQALLQVVSNKKLDATLEVVNRNRVGAQVVSHTPVALARGNNEIPWAPPPSTRPGSYILRLRESDTTPAPVLGSAVVRVLDVEATFRQRSAQPGQTVTLSVQTDAPWLRMTLLRCGIEPEPTNSNYEMRGIQVGDPQRIDLSRGRGRKAAIPVTLNVDASGVYAVRLEGPSGHKGFAPLVVRPVAPVQRTAVVIPTTTWHAYNYYDHNGDGFGDTWYSLWAQKRIDLTRPHLRAGVPERWRSYDLQFLHWMTTRGHQADVYADEDIDLFPNAETLRGFYDVIVFPGHTEYVTKRLYDLIQGFRDLGGRLILLSANNFFRRVDRAADHAKLIGEWRNLGRPESSVLGIQYLANDDGKRQEPFTVVGADTAPWAFVGTGLRNGSTFGRYGIEIDGRAASSPPGVQVLATIPDLLGPGRTAEMSYYETEQGARVFSAGVLNFGGTIMLWPETGRLLDNVWARMAADL